MLLTGIDDDTLIYIISFLHPLQLLTVRKTCKRMYILTQLRIVWTNACVYHITGQGYPFPNTALDTLPIRKLEQHVCHAARLSTNWLSNDWTLIRKWSIDATANTSVGDVRIMPGSEGSIIFTLSKSVWSVLTVWKLEPVTSKTTGENCKFCKCCEWSPKGAIFNGFTLNSSPSSEAKLAISVVNNGNQTVELLSLRGTEESGDLSLQVIMSIPSTLKPITLEGDLLALSDDLGETIILNWKTSASATLQHVLDGQGIWQYDNCIQVVFAFQSILVVRARSLHLFPQPILRKQEDGPLQYSPLSRHSFGWIDGVSVTMMDRHCESPPTSPPRDHPNWRPLSLLVRAETDDPWSPDNLTVELYTLDTNPNFNPSEPPPDPSIFQKGANNAAGFDPALVPYTFPPVLSSKVSSRRGTLRCADIVLGRLGTAIWVQPRDRSTIGLYWSNDDVPLRSQHIPRLARENESLVAAVFPGSRLLPESHDVQEGVSDRVVVETQSRVLAWNERNNWSCGDYDEDVGRIVLGSGFGEITVIDL